MLRYLSLCLILLITCLGNSSCASKKKGCPMTIQAQTPWQLKKQKMKRSKNGLFDRKMERKIERQKK
jgi:hypothetical protein